jgi:hypothetical protein
LTSLLGPSSVKMGRFSPDLRPSMNLLQALRRYGSNLIDEIHLEILQKFEKRKHKNILVLATYVFNIILNIRRVKLIKVLTFRINSFSNCPKQQNIKCQEI